MFDHSKFNGVLCHCSVEYNESAERLYCAWLCYRSLGIASYLNIHDNL